MMRFPKLHGNPLTKKFTLTLLGMAVTALLLLGEEAWARAGGGHSYSGGGGGSSRRSGSSFGGGSSYSGGGGDGEFAAAVIEFLVRILIRMHLTHPMLALTVDLLIVAGIVLYQMDRKRRGSQTFTYSSAPVPTGRDELPALRMDPLFSRPLFLDFAGLLFARFHQARGTSLLAQLSGYFDKAILDAGSDPGLRVTQVIVGGIRLWEADTLRPGWQCLRVDFTANSTESRDGAPGTVYYFEEKWIFSRKQGAMSKGPEDILALNCPACGSASERGADGRCGNCGTMVSDGRFDWFVTSRTVLNRSTRGPALGSDAPEVGTDFPTVFQSDVVQNLQELQKRDKAISRSHLESTAQRIFLEIQNAWSSLSWEKARPWQTQALFSTHLYWISEYKRAGLRNLLEDIEVKRVEITRIESDAWFDSFTARIHASMKDSTVEIQGGRVVSGSRSRRRAFSEYWTFIRRNEAKESGKGHDKCPNCGALLKINMAGNCEYCGSEVCSGKFGWVASRIEQDEEVVAAPVHRDDRPVRRGSHC